MKKSLLAVAAMGAFASAAQAQSSVTVYGILDMGYIGSNSRDVAAGTAPGIGGSPTAVTKVQKSALGASAEQTNRLGFKGVEDLGGGSSAFFTVELGLQPQNGNLSGTDPADRLQNTSQGGGSAIDNRQSFLGLKKNGLGQFAFGRQYTPIFNAGAATDPGQYNNIVGNVIYSSGSVYASNQTTSSGVNNNIGFTNRASNALTLKSDSFAGFTASAMYAMNNANRTEGGTTQTSLTQGNNNWGGWGVGADFTWQKLYVTAAYQSFAQNISGTIAPSGTGDFNLNGAGPNASQIATTQTTTTSQLSDKQTYVGATYDFGILKAYAQWVGRKVQQNSGTATLIDTGAAIVPGSQVNRTAEQIGVRSYVTPAIEVWASGGMGSVKGPLQASQDPGSVHFTAYQLGSNYYLSKRTNLYAIYGQTQSSSSTAGTAGSGNSANQYALGLRHTF